MKQREPFPDGLLERETRAIEALDAAHKLPRGPALGRYCFPVARFAAGIHAARFFARTSARLSIRPFAKQKPRQLPKQLTGF
jgi:hypothetical protein